MSFRILGPLEVRIGSTEVTIARREWILLATLLLHANRTVSVERIADAIWGERPPRDSAGQVHSSVYRLRKRLAAGGPPDGLVVTHPAGYQVRVDPRNLDLAAFRGLRDQARAASARGDQEEARTLFRAGLDLWRGPALDGIDSDLLRKAAAALDEEHLQALEQCAEIELALDRAEELIPEITDLVRQHPYREGLHGKLMLALYRTGRQADALAAYRHLRKIMHDEVGVEPGPELQRLHQAILNRDRALDLPLPPKAAPELAGGTRPTPRELPAAVAGFTGRADALMALDEMLTGGAEGTPGSVVISAIAGTAGIGKTALAVHWAHLAIDRFPDGQLYVDLRGYGPEQPLPPTHALARLLSAVGVADQDIPLDLDGRAARYRSELAGRRMLIVLDNASSVEQICPLLPGSGSFMVVVTSRDSLAGLVAVHGAHRLDLDLLPPTEAITLLHRLIGARVDGEPNAAIALANLCARLPLALRVAAELAISRPIEALAGLVDELADRQRRLDLLDAGGDPHAAMKVVFSWSIQHLSLEVVHTFRLLGLHPGPDFDTYAVAALANTGLVEARHTLDLLVRANLICRTGPGRYGMHDLLRAYATHLASTENSETDRRAAWNRLFDYYLAAAAAAMDSRYPAEVHHRRRVTASATHIPTLTEPDTAQAWLDVELLCLVSIGAYTATHGFATYAIQLSSTLHRYLDGGRYYDALAIHGYAHHAAQHAGDTAEQAHALRYLGFAHLRMSRYGPAADHLQQALALFRWAGDEAGEALALTNLGTVDRRLSNHAAAIGRFRQALAMFQHVGDQIGEATALASLGIVEQRLGRFGPASDHHRQALAIYQRVGDKTGEASALINIGVVERRLGRFGPASDHHRQALATYRKLGNLQGEADALENLGAVHLCLGEPGYATELFAQARSLFREIGDRAGEAWTFNGLGEAATAAGHPTDALTYHTDALSLATATDTRDQQARAHVGLGQAHQALGDPGRAHYEYALTLYTDLDMPDADDVRAHLAATWGHQVSGGGRG